MGVIISRFRTKPSTVEVLEGIDKDIQTGEECRELYQRQLKQWLWRLLLYSSLLYLMASIIVYLWYLPEQTIGKVILALPCVIFPLFVWLLRKGLIALFKRRTENNNEKLDDLKSQKRKILLEVMETETYKTAKMILERFDPDSKAKVPESLPNEMPMTPKPHQELRQRHVTPRPPVAVTPAAARPPRPPVAVTPAAASLLLAPGATHAGPPLHSAPGGPPERILSEAAQQNLMKRPMTPGTLVPGVGPPLARPVLPRDRGTMDRVIEYLVGDGPQNRYALICQQCLTHNGMALKEEFEYIAFRCAYCCFLNPARKIRPQAPRLPEISAETKILTDAPVATPPEADESPVAAVEEKWPSPPAEEEIQELAVTPTEGAPETKGSETPGCLGATPGCLGATPGCLGATPEKSDEELDMSDMEVQ
ncbi:endoplasmic reticulum junction formation protein lunapark-A [Salvelinus sp. IW2-2015]|uniref:endoplasmic reticulum junction formation protein lunapark-A n=1 Tax=Salvelinus sp. IW2-2015 TaxID=2691554 RepID=UPI000CDFACEE|nr:endoplasmic reticulum junction formation protein lunapark-A isoform X1 [Salvelinus alpinus]